jgi:hypothetical protein
MSEAEEDAFIEWVRYASLMLVIVVLTAVSLAIWRGCS